MNKDEEAYRLDRVYDQIITKRQPKSLANTSSSQTKKFADILKHLEQSEQDSWQEVEIFLSEYFL